MKIPVSPSRSVQLMSKIPVKPTVSPPYAIDHDTLSLLSRCRLSRSSAVATVSVVKRGPQKRVTSGRICQSVKSL